MAFVSTVGVTGRHPFSWFTPLCYEGFYDVIARCVYSRVTKYRNGMNLLRFNQKAINKTVLVPCRLCWTGVLYKLSLRQYFFLDECWMSWCQCSHHEVYCWYLLLHAATAAVIVAINFRLNLFLSKMLAHCVAFRSNTGLKWVVNAELLWRFLCTRTGAGSIIRLTGRTWQSPTIRMACCIYFV